ncbi:MAG: hypothetical protein K0Q63_875 [Paenibacillus sp.]|nr:hypothetical protein [Paenibacillus sp.]
MEKGKWKVALLAIATVVAATGCSQANNGNANDPNQGTEKTSDGGTSGEDATVKISVASMPKYPPNEIPNDYVEEVEKRFGMQWDFESIPLTAGIEKYNVMFASGDYPDFIPNMNSPTSVKKWASSGYLLPIGDYIDRLPNYRKLFSDEDWELLLSYGSSNGKLYMLPSVASSDPMTWIYRKDAFDKAGIASFPATMDELYESVKKLKEAYPDSVPIGVRGGTENGGVKNLMNGFRQAFRNPQNSNTRGFWNDPDEGGKVVWNLASTKHRDMLTFIAKLYKEGLVEKEFATLTQDQWKAKRLTGKVLLDFQYASHTVDPDYALTDIPGGQWEFARTLPSASEQPALEFKPLNFSLFGPVFSSKLADEPEKLDRLIEYVEWGATAEGQLFHQAGLDNVTYVNEGGTLKYKEGLDRQKVAEQHGFDWWLSQSADFMKSDAGYLKKQEAMKEFAPNYNVTPKNAPLTDEEQETVGTTVSALEDVAYQFATKAIMGMIDIGSDEAWNGYLSDLEKVGLNETRTIFEKYLK